MDENLPYYFIEKHGVERENLQTFYDRISSYFNADAEVPENVLPIRFIHKNQSTSYQLFNIAGSSVLIETEYEPYSRKVKDLMIILGSRDVNSRRKAKTTLTQITGKEFCMERKWSLYHKIK